MMDQKETSPPKDFNKDLKHDSREKVSLDEAPTDRSSTNGNEEPSDRFTRNGNEEQAARFTRNDNNESADRLIRSRNEPADISTSNGNEEPADLSTRNGNEEPTDVYTRYEDEDTDVVVQSENNRNNNIQTDSSSLDSHGSRAKVQSDLPKMDSSEDSDDTVIEQVVGEDEIEEEEEEEEEDGDVSEENVVAASMHISLDGAGPVTQQISVTGSNRSSPVKEVSPEKGSSSRSRGSVSPKKEAPDTDEKKLDLPDTVTILTSPEGSTVYLVGTAHFSMESQEDVAKTIQTVMPDVVLVELCKGRVNILQLDEEKLLEEARNISFERVRQVIRQSGFVQGVMYLLLLNLSAHLTKQLGMAPGGEFRRAFAEAKRIPRCVTSLGDRPIQVTLQRALAALSPFQKMRLGWKMLTSNDPISKEEVEKCKQRDLLEEMLAEMTGEFPALSEVFVKERDIYLASSLQVAGRYAISQKFNSSGNPVPPVVVGVVGIGHVPGIVKNWGKVNEEDVSQLLLIPPPSLFGRVLKTSVKVVAVGGLCYFVYRLLPDSVIRNRLPPLHNLKLPFL